MHSNLRTNQVHQNLMWSVSVSKKKKKKVTQKHEIKRKTGQRAERLSQIQNDMQCKGAERRLGKGGWWRKTSNWPRCGFSQTLYIIAQFLYKHRRCDREEKSKGGHGFYLSHLLCRVEGSSRFGGLEGRQDGGGRKRKQRDAPSRSVCQ